jgi:hypothetical protein
MLVGSGVPKAAASIAIIRMSHFGSSFATRGADENSSIKLGATR